MTINVPADLHLYHAMKHSEGPLVARRSRKDLFRFEYTRLGFIEFVNDLQTRQKTLMYRWQSKNKIFKILNQGVKFRFLTDKNI